jgi:hypothetical protein
MDPTAGPPADRPPVNSHGTPFRSFLPNAACGRSLSSAAPRPRRPVPYLRARCAGVQGAAGPARQGGSGHCCGLVHLYCGAPGPGPGPPPTPVRHALLYDPIRRTGDSWTLEGSDLSKHSEAKRALPLRARWPPHLCTLSLPGSLCTAQHSNRFQFACVAQ